MKRIVRHFFINILALYFVNVIASGMIFEKGIETFFLTGAALTAATILAKPVINVLLIPLNLITFGLFRWVSSAIALYLVKLVVPGFNIVFFKFGGLSTKWIDIPAMNFEGIVAFVSFSFILSVIISFIYWVRK